MTDQPPRGPAVPAAPTLEALRQQQRSQVLRTALQSPIPRLYANSFGIAQTESDVSIILLVNGSPTGMVSMSYISAKSLATELDKVVKRFEDAIGDKVQTVSEISPKLKQVMEKSGVSKL